MLEVALIALLALFAALAVRPLRSAAPVAHWVAAWCAAAIAGVIPVAFPTLLHLQLVTQPFATLSAALMMSGAYALAQRPVPRWWLPAAFGFGVVRALVAFGFGARAGYALGLVVEPAAIAAGALAVWRLARQGDCGVSGRLLGPAMGGLGVAAAIHLAWLAAGRPILELVPLWLAVAPPVLGLQIQAAGDRLRRALRRGLEERVAARTRALSASEDRYRTISQLASDFAFKIRLDRDGRLVREWIAGAFEATLGWPLESIDGHGWMQVLEPGAREEMVAEYRRVALDRAVAFERRIVTQDREPRWIQLRLAKVYREANGDLEILGSARDITELKRAEQESEGMARHVEQVQRLESLGILAGGIAHDFNNLLTVIRGSAQLALRELPPDAPARARVARIAEAAQHAAALTDQMLAYAGRSSPKRAPLDLGALVATMADLLRASVPAPCTLVFEQQEDLPAVEADASALQQVLLNLVLNAAESQRGGGLRVVVRTAVVAVTRERLRDAFGAADMAPGNVVELSVRDDGCGMDAETTARVFEPFFSTKFSGRGLGMAAVLGIVRAHHGAICIESEVGGGTCVRVLFPPRAGHASTGEPLHAAPAVARSATVLVVDDDEGIVELATEVLARAGFRVLPARGGREALDQIGAAGAGAVDAVVLDLAMPDMSGEETLVRLRELRSDLPVILVTGYDAARFEDRFVPGGLDAFLRKPWESEDLVAALRAVMGGRS